MATKETRHNLEAVVIGGGTGNSTVLEGLKPWVGDGLTAIVNTFDDGGGTGKLRDLYEDLPAVGDLRQCIRALSNALPDETALLDHRFHEGSRNGELGIHGQTLGNLILVAASQHNKGNFAEALGLLSGMYKITGRVMAATEDSRRLKITTPEGLVIEGEHAAEEAEIPSLKGSKVGFDIEPTRITETAASAIARADMVVLAPGDLYTSLAPVLVVEGFKEALENTSAVVVMTANLMNRSRHTAGFDALDYAQEYERHIGAKVIDCILYNNEPLDEEALYEQATVYGSHPVVADEEALRAAGYTVTGKNLLSHERPKIDPNDEIKDSRSIILHDSRKVGYALMETYFAFADKKAKRLGQ